MFDLAIIGGGPAGISAAIHAKRLGLKVVLIEKNELGGQARAANLIENYPGVPSVNGNELMDKFTKQLSGADMAKNEATSVTKRGEFFITKTDAANFESRHVLIACGLEPVKLPFCNNALYYPNPKNVPHGGKKVLIIGGGDAAFDEAVSFSAKAKTVEIAMRSLKPKAIQRLIDRAARLGIKIKTGLKEEEIAAMKADVVVACAGKKLNLDIVDSSALREIMLAGDVLHPDIRHIAVAVGDGIAAVEYYANNLKNR